MTYHHQTNTPITHIVFYSLLDALAFIIGVCFGAFALGYVMSWYFFGA